MSSKVQHVAVLTRAIPIDVQCDTVTGIFLDGTTLAEVSAWAKEACAGQCHLIRLELSIPFEPESK